MKIINTLLFSLLAGSISAQVGIGTTSPDVALDIEAAGAAIDINNTSTDPLIHFQVSGTTNFTIGTDVTDNKFKIGTTALETGTAITVQPTGEVGIGTSTPLEELHVDGQVLTTTVAYGNSQDQAYLIAGTQSYTGATTNWGTYGFQHRFKSTGSGVGRITVDDATGELFCIENGGNVGIGTSAPTVALDIEAAGAAIDINNTSTDPLIHFQVSGTTNFTIGTDITDSKFKIGTTALETGTAITVQSDGDIQFDNYSTGYSKFDGSGNISSATDLIYDKGTSISAATSWDITDPGMYGVGSGSVFTGTDHPGTDMYRYGHLMVSEGGSGRVQFYFPHYGSENDASGDRGRRIRVRTGYGGSGYSDWGSILLSNQDQLPEADATYDLGSSTYKWNEVFAANGTVNTSDRRLKKDIDSLGYGLAEVMQLKPVSFYWKTDSTNSKKKIGYIAQDVQKVIPEVVHVGDDEEKRLGIYYSDMVVVLTRAIQEQQAIIEAQNQRIDSQKEKIETQDSEIENLKQETSSASTDNANKLSVNAKKIAALEAKLNALLLNQNVTLSAKK